MATVIKGIVKNGIIEPLEPLNEAEGCEVTITVADKPTSEPGQRIYFGMFKEWGPFNDEDFKAAEWHGDPDDGLDWTGC